MTKGTGFDLSHDLTAFQIFLFSFQEYMAKARELERELRALTIEKARADAMLEVCIYTTGLCLRVRTKKNFLISHPKHMLWVLKRIISMRRFF